MKSAEVRAVVEEKYRDYQDQVIEKFEAAAVKARKAGANAGPGAWEMLKTQLKEEGGIFFDSSTEKLRSLCVRLVKGLPSSEIKLLWLRTDAYFDYDGLSFPDRETMEEAVWEELNQGLFRHAAASDTTDSEINAEHNGLADETGLVSGEAASVPLPQAVDDPERASVTGESTTLQHGSSKESDGADGPQGAEATEAAAPKQATGRGRRKIKSEVHPEIVEKMQATLDL